MSTVYPWWQVASDIAKAGGYDDAVLEELDKSKVQEEKRMAGEMHEWDAASKARIVAALVSESGQWNPRKWPYVVKAHAADCIIQDGDSVTSALASAIECFPPTLLNPFDKEITDQKGRDPVQAAARTDVAQAVWIGLCKGSLPAYYPDGIRMPVDEVQAAGLSLQGVYVEPVSVNALLKAAVHAELVWTPGGAQIEPRNGRGVSAQARQDVEILETLRRKGYDPRRLPKNPPGKSGVRSEVRKALGAAGAWSGTTVFKRAWQRLRDAGEIADG